MCMSRKVATMMTENISSPTFNLLMMARVNDVR